MQSARADSIRDGIFNGKYTARIQIIIPAEKSVRKRKYIAFGGKTAFVGYRHDQPLSPFLKLAADSSSRIFCRATDTFYSALLITFVV